MTGSGPAHGFLAWTYYLSGRREDAAATMERGATLAGAADPFRMAYVKAFAGDEPAARALLAEVERSSSSTYVPPIGVARVFALLDDTAGTLAWLARALDERDPWCIYLAVDPIFAPLRTEPAFARLLARLGLPPVRS